MNRILWGACMLLVVLVGCRSYEDADYVPKRSWHVSCGDLFDGIVEEMVHKDAPISSVWYREENGKRIQLPDTCVWVEE